MNTTELWICCDDVYSREGIAEHLVIAHGIKRPINSQRRALEHIDGDGWAINAYEHTIGDLVLYQAVQTTEVLP